MSEASAQTPVVAVGVICLRERDVLLIRRGKPPRRGEWSLPGGRVKWGETVREAALRELREETGVEAELGPLLEVVDGVFRDEAGMVSNHYVLLDFTARWLAGEPRPGGDALEARFHPLEAVASLGMWAETTRVIVAAATVSLGAR